LGRYQAAIDALDKVSQGESSLAKWVKKCEDKGAVKPVFDAVSAARDALAKLNAPKEPVRVAKKVRHEWYQDEQFVTVSVFIKKIATESVNVDFSERALSLCIKLEAGTDFTLDFDPLANEIDVQGIRMVHLIILDCKFSVLSTQVQIKLKKKMFGVKWAALEQEDAIVDDGPAYPTSSKKKVDWNAVEKSVDAEKPEGEAALNGLSWILIHRVVSEYLQGRKLGHTEGHDEELHGE
jgi:suppressor of G2 allele of SKP1